MNTDPRGVKRGRCEACECDAYEYNTDKGPSCFYCLCAPTKHIRLGMCSIFFIQHIHFLIIVNSIKKK